MFDYLSSDESFHRRAFGWDVEYFGDAQSKNKNDSIRGECAPKRCRSQLQRRREPKINLQIPRFLFRATIGLRLSRISVLTDSKNLERNII